MAKIMGLLMCLFGILGVADLAWGIAPAGILPEMQKEPFLRFLAWVSYPAFSLIGLGIVYPPLGRYLDQISAEC